MTAFLHYFFLATFTWTLCEAILIYILLVKVFGANDKKWIYLYLALGWGKSLPTALTSLAAWTGTSRFLSVIYYSINVIHIIYVHIRERIIIIIILHYSVCFVRYKWCTHSYLENAVASFSFNTVSSAYSNCGYKWRSEEQGLSD